MEANPSFVDGLRQLIDTRRRNGVTAPLSPVALEIARQYGLLPKDEQTAVTPLLSPLTPEIEPETAVETWIIPERFDVYGRILERFKATGVILLWWLVAWAIGKANHHNYVPVDVLEKHFTGSGQFRLCQRNHFRYKVLKDGARLGLWTYDRAHGRIFFASRARVAVIMGLEAVGGHAVNVSLADLCAGLVGFRAQCHATGIASKGDGYSSPISRQNITNDTQISKRTQRKYEGLAGVEVRQNYELITKYTPRTYAIKKKAERKRYQDTGDLPKPAIVVSVVRDDGELRKYICHQIPNSYTLPTTKTVAHSRRRLNRRVKYLRKKLPGDGPTAVPASAFGSEIQQRTYYETENGVRPDTVGYYWMGKMANNTDSIGFWRMKCTHDVGTHDKS